MGLDVVVGSEAVEVVAVVQAAVGVAINPRGSDEAVGAEALSEAVSREEAPGIDLLPIAGLGYFASYYHAYSYTGPLIVILLLTKTNLLIARLTKSLQVS